MAIVDDNTKKKYLRRLRRRSRDAVELSQQADQQIEKLLIGRFNRLISVKRFVVLWLALFILLFFATFIQLRDLSGYYQSLQPVPGGLYSEGVIGSFTNANPLYATGSANVAVSRLVFSGLFKYDKNNRFVGDLATGYSLDTTQTNYMVNLRPNVSWHDGKPFTADDVIYTYTTIQTIGAQSPLFSSWRDIEVIKKDSKTVIFDLPNALSSFPHALTNGIVPKHLLADTPPEALRSSPFNSKPIGTGPFEWRFVEVSGKTADDRRQRISLAAYDRYWSGRPKLDGFSLLSFTDENQLIQAFKNKQINAMSGLEDLPEELQKDESVFTYVTPLTGAVMSFFNNSRPILDNATVRQALVSGVNRRELTNLTPFLVKLVNGPLLREQVGYDPNLIQLPSDPNHANQLLDRDGWLRDASGQRSKGGQQLAFVLSSQDTKYYGITAKFLQEEWAKLGVKVTVQYYGADELQASIIANHDYDALLYGITIGVDPDVFAYWESSQATPGSQGYLNLSEYKSAVADQSLQAGRIRTDPTQRTIKYRDFLNAWRSDAPALALYQPNFLYITRGPVFGYERSSSNSATDRFFNVADWTVRQKRQSVE